MNPISPATTPPAPPAHVATAARRTVPWAIVVPILLMVLAAMGVGGTLLAANSQASLVPAGPNQMPAGARPSGAFQRPGGFPSGAFTPGQRPSGFPSGMYTPGAIPSGFPSGRPSGFTPGAGRTARPGGATTTPMMRGPMTLNAWQIAVIAGCGVVFVGAAALLVMVLRDRQRSALTPAVPPPAVP